MNTSAMGLMVSLFPGKLKSVYAQDKEDEFLADYFGDFVGRFLDLGAGDGKTISNTYLLLERGWEGVHVEPSWRTVAAYRENMRQFALRTTLIQAAVIPRKPLWSLVPYWDHDNSLISTCSQPLQDRGHGRETAKLILVGSVGVEELMNYGPFDAISIDIEGLSLGVLGELGLSETKAVVVETFGKEVLGVDEFALAEEIGKWWGFQTKRTLENVILFR